MVFCVSQSIYSQGEKFYGQSFKQPAPAEETSDAEAPVEADVPREYRQALRSAENYLSFSGFSYDGLYDQLTSEYASMFSPEATQYAVDTVFAQ